MNFLIVLSTLLAVTTASQYHSGLAAPYGGYGHRVAHHGHLGAPAQIVAQPSYAAPLVAGPAVRSGDYTRVSSVSGVAPGFPTLPRVVAAPPAFHQHSAGVVAANVAHHRFAPLNHGHFAAPIAAAPVHAPVNHGHFAAAPVHGSINHGHFASNIAAAHPGFPTVTLPFETAVPTHGHLTAGPVVTSHASPAPLPAPIPAPLPAPLPVHAAPVQTVNHFGATAFHAPTHQGHLTAPAVHHSVRLAEPAPAHGHLAAPVAAGPAVQTGTYAKVNFVSGVSPGSIAPIHAGIHPGPHAPLIANGHLAGPAHSHALSQGNVFAIPLPHPHGFSGHLINLIK